MTDNISERIENAINDIEKVQNMFRERYGEDCVADKEIAEVLKIARAEHGELRQYRAIGAVEECREAAQRKNPKKPVKDKYNRECCPNCGWVVNHSKWGGRYLNCCENCGQAISWERDNE